MPKDKSFTQRVHFVVKNIPSGETRTYAEVAKLAGSPGAARAVGNIMKANYDRSIPCHRVVKADGTIGDYNRGGPTQKKKLLAQEHEQKH